MAATYQYGACRSWGHAWNADLVLNHITPLTILKRQRKHVSPAATHLLTSTTQCIRCHTFVREFYSLRFVSVTNYTLIDRLPSKSYRYAEGYLIHDGKQHPRVEFKMDSIEDAISKGLLIEIVAEEVG